MIDTRILKSIDKENEVWILYDSEGSDPYFKKFITDKTVVMSMAIVSLKGLYLIVHKLDADNFKNLNGKLIIYEKKKEIISILKNIFAELNYPDKIYLNFSDRLDSNTDILGHGAYNFINYVISNIYVHKKFKFSSADEIIYKLVDSKSNEDINYMKISARRALEIIEAVFRKIRIGMTERKIFALFHEEFKLKPKYFQEYGIVNEYYSWSESSCPIVLIGPNLSKGGHCMAGDQELREGFTVYCDFGVVIELKDGKKYASDLQRMGYALSDGEDCPPEEVNQVFNTLKESIDMGIKNCLPSKRGYEIDEIVRNHLTKKGYPSYNHATGHPVGEVAHSPGTSLSPRGNLRSDLFLQENGVYTIEPRIQIENGGSIEEMVQVTKNGGVPLCPVQERLYII